MSGFRCVFLYFQGLGSRSLSRIVGLIGQLLREGVLVVLVCGFSLNL